MRVRKTSAPTRACLTILVLFIIGGCTIRIGRRDDEPPAAPTTIAIRIVNDTPYALEPQVFVGAIANGLSQLYRSTNQRSDFGLGARGLVEPGKQVTISTACDPPVYIATQGGIFGEDLNFPRGQGQPIVLEQNRNVYCGDLVTFTFSATGNTLRTSHAVEPL